MTLSLDIADRLAVEFAGLPAGTRVAGEHEIMRRFEVGRSAARSALQELERRLIVRRARGSGTYVNRRIDYVLSRDRRPSWHETVTAAGARPRSVVRDIAVRPLPTDRAALLDLQPGTPAHLLRRLSYIDDLLASCSREWVPVATLPNLGDALHAVESLDAVLRQVAGLDPWRSWSRVSHEVPPPDVLADLEMAAPEPLSLVESVSRDRGSGAPVMCSSGWMRPDMVRVVVELGE